MSIECTSKTVWRTRVVCSRCPASASYELNQRDTLLELKKLGWSCQFMGLDLCSTCFEKDEGIKDLRKRSGSYEHGVMSFHGFQPKVLWFEEVVVFPATDYRNLSTDEGGGP